MKKKDWIRVLILTICGAILGINIYSANSNNLFGNKLPMPFGFGAAVVLSGSMEPEMSVGDLVIVREKEEYQKEDIVVFQEASILVVHRIIELNANELTTKGDANNIADSPISVSDIKGKVIFTLPFVGFVVEWLKTPIGIVATLALSIYLIIASNQEEQSQRKKELDKIRKEIDEIKNELNESK